MTSLTLSTYLFQRYQQQHESSESKCVLLIGVEDHSNDARSSSSSRVIQLIPFTSQ